MVHTIGEASSSRSKRRKSILPRRQKKHRIFSFHDEDNEEKCEEVVQSGTLLKQDLLDCPICNKPLKTPIYQCDNGHVACSSCCVKVRYICHACTSPIGDYRARLMERIVESIVFPCPYAKNGCKEKVSRAKEAEHTKECGFVSGYCSELFCNYTGSYQELYKHFETKHKNKMYIPPPPAWRF